jgi:hypothetical protein
MSRERKYRRTAQKEGREFGKRGNAMSGQSGRIQTAVGFEMGNRGIRGRCAATIFIAYAQNLRSLVKVGAKSLKASGLLKEICIVDKN